MYLTVKVLCPARLRLPSRSMWIVHRTLCLHLHGQRVHKTSITDRRMHVRLPFKFSVWLRGLAPADTPPLPQPKEVHQVLLTKHDRIAPQYSIQDKSNQEENDGQGVVTTCWTNLVLSRITDFALVLFGPRPFLAQCVQKPTTRMRRLWPCRLLLWKPRPGACSLKCKDAASLQYRMLAAHPSRLGCPQKGARAVKPLFHRTREAADRSQLPQRQ